MIYCLDFMSRFAIAVPNPFHRQVAYAITMAAQLRSSDTGACHYLIGWFESAACLSVIGWHIYPVSPQITGQLMKHIMCATFIGTPASSVTLLSTPVHRVSPGNFTRNIHCHFIRYSTVIANHLLGPIFFRLLYPTCLSPIFQQQATDHVQHQQQSCRFCRNLQKFLYLHLEL